MATLKKVVRLGTVQVCTIKKALVFFRKLDSGLWEQASAYENMLAYTVPSEKLLVYNADDFLNSSSVSVRLKRLKRGIYEPEPDR